MSGGCKRSGSAASPGVWRSSPRHSCSIRICPGAMRPTGCLGWLGAAMQGGTSFRHASPARPARRRPSQWPARRRRSRSAVPVAGPLGAPASRRLKRDGASALAGVRSKKEHVTNKVNAV